jgi:2-polyprenyl-6-methoxyphenol hydroxylase-like FAD-dependent oxidoreductase
LSAHDKQAPVIIVGGGPVGMGLAIEFGQRGIRAIVVERYRSPQPIPKGQNLTQRTTEHFWFWGAERELRAARTIPLDYGIGGMTAYGTLLSGHAHDWMQRELVRPYYFTDNERLPQYATEDVLRARAKTLETLDLMFGWTAERLVQDEHGVTVEVGERGGSGRMTLRGDYAVGCDGSRSVTREEAGISQTLSDHDRLMVLLVFKSSKLHEHLKRYPGKSFYNVLHPELKGYWKFFGRVDLGTTWFFHAPVPPGTTRDNFDFKRLLYEAAGDEFDVAFDHVGFWDLRIATADNYRAGRVFVAGDAAHSHPPYGGYGINTGFEDARNLGWKLAATLQGWGGEQLLDSYNAERRPVFASTARDFIEKSIETDRAFVETYDPTRDLAAFDAAWKGRTSGARTEVDAFEPNYRGSPLVFGLPGAETNAKGAHTFRAQPGHHLAPQMLSSGRNLFEELGSGFSLIALDAADATVTAFSQAAEVMKVPLKIIRDSFADKRTAYEAKLVLVRPDHFVAWCANEAPADTGAILRKAIGSD